MIDSCLFELQALQALWGGFGVLNFAILCATVGAAILAPLLPHFYSKTIARFMKFQQVAPPPLGWAQRRARKLDRPKPPTAQIALSLPLAEARVLRESRVRRATMIAYGAFIVWGLMVGELRGGGSLIVTCLAMLLLAGYAAGPAIVNIAPAGSRGLLLGFAVVVVVMNAGIQWLRESISVIELIPGTTLLIVLFSLSLHRTLRSLFVPLTALAGAAALGFVTLTFGYTAHVCTSGAASVKAVDTLVDISIRTIGYFVFAACILGALLLLGGFARLHERGVVSDLSLAAGFGLLAVVAHFSATNDPTPSPNAITWLVWSGVTIAAYVLALRRMPQPSGSRTLLLLRVFSKDRQMERLLDGVQTRWRYAGPVLQIGGPDLAKLNIEPYDLLKFVSFKAHELFLPGELSLDELRNSLDLAPDREGRFRVNEVFCFDTAWRSTVEKLIDLSDVILLDLRGFSAERKGTAFEVKLLSANRKLARVLAIGDETTDWTHVDALLGKVREGAREVRLDAREKLAMLRCIERLERLATGEAGGSC